MKLYLCALDIPNESGIAFIRFAPNEVGAKDWKRREQIYLNTVARTDDSLVTKARIFEVEAREL